MGNVTLKTKFVVLISALIAASLLANLAWTSVNKRAQMENELREKGEVLAQQMDAMWEFMACASSSLQNCPTQVSSAELLAQRQPEILASILCFFLTS